MGMVHHGCCGKETDVYNVNNFVIFREIDQGMLIAYFL